MAETNEFFGGICGQNGVDASSETPACLMEHRRSSPDALTQGFLLFNDVNHLELD